MDPRGNIYRAAEDEIPAEDKARLDGYLGARAEADAKAHLEVLREQVRAHEHEDHVRRITRLLEDRLDFWLPGGEGLREALPDLAREIATLDVGADRD